GRGVSGGGRGRGRPVRPARPPGRPPRPCPPARGGGLRVIWGCGRSARGSPSPPRTPPPGSIPTFPHPGGGEMGGGLPGGADGWTGLPHPHPPFVLVDGPPHPPFILGAGHTRKTWHAPPHSGYHPSWPRRR